MYLAEVAQDGTDVNEHGWDGEWFLRAYDDFGDKIGSKECEEGKIFIESQWLLRAGRHRSRRRQSRQGAGRRRRAPGHQHGIVLQQPAYSKYYLDLGEISSYPPGYKENAGIFCHVNPWVMIAETAWDTATWRTTITRRINPSAREEISDLHRCEPYVYAQMIAGKDAPTFGEAKNSWLTGTAAWNYYAIVQWILGIRTSLEGLEIAPVIPRNWPGFTATRTFRGVVYKVSIERKGDGNAIALTVDGSPIEGNVVPVPADGRTEVSVKGILS